jgi:hypothetical protein
MSSNIFVKYTYILYMSFYVNENEYLLSPKVTRSLQSLLKERLYILYIQYRLQYIGRVITYISTVLMVCVIVYRVHNIAHGRYTNQKKLRIICSKFFFQPDPEPFASFHNLLVLTVLMVVI